MLTRTALFTSLTLVVSLLLPSPVPAASPGELETSALTAAAPSTAKINDALRKLAVALAPALDEEEARTALQKVLSENSGAPFLGSLLNHRLADGTLFGERLAETWPAKGPGQDAAFEELAILLEAIPGIELRMPFGLEGWDQASEAPGVTYVPEGQIDKESPRLELFGTDGSSDWIDPRIDAGAPLLALSYRDLSEYKAPEGELPSVWLEPAGASADKGTCTTINTYRSNPLINWAQIRDIHEGAANGPEGFAYFAAAGTEKTGNLPPSLGGESGWSTNVWASNFQGPKWVGNSRDQWEWTTDGWLQSLWREYPLTYCQQTNSSASGLTLASYTIKEDDEWWNPDDYVGKLQIDHRFCKSDVFDRGLTSGWSNYHSTPGIDDVEYSRYKLYCTKATSCRASVGCLTGTVSCSAPASCSSGACTSGPDWVECNGQRTYCASICDLGLCDPFPFPIP